VLVSAFLRVQRSLNFLNSLGLSNSQLLEFVQVHILERIKLTWFVAEQLQSLLVSMNDKGTFFLNIFVDSFS
jgi:hypothetical protein